MVAVAQHVPNDAGVRQSLLCNLREMPIPAGHEDIDDSPVHHHVPMGREQSPSAHSVSIASKPWDV
jgi:hypothetical protein